MIRRLPLVLPLLFVFVFAFTLVITMHGVARADGCGYMEPIPGCCILTVQCNHGTPDAYWVCGYGVWNGEACIPDRMSGCPAPAICIPSP